MDLKQWIALGGFLIVAIGSVVGAVEYFAKDADLQLVEYRLEQKIKHDRVYELQQQLWQLEDRYRGKPVDTWPPEDRDRYRKVKHKLEELKGS